LAGDKPFIFHDLQHVIVCKKFITNDLQLNYSSKMGYGDFPFLSEQTPAAGVFLDF